jgi:hypothetical protein
MKRLAASRAYFAYIRSEDWRQSPARLAELTASGGRCRLCDRGEPLTRIHAHHRSYERLGRELPSDLTALCIECHEVVTPHVRRVRREARIIRQGAKKRLPPAPKIGSRGRAR